MDEHVKARITSQSDAASISTELASRRTGMSFQRTRMSADRTLMWVIRTSLSLIGFGFTLFQVFEKLHESNVLKSGEAPRHFGLTLVVLGVAMLVGRHRLPRVLVLGLRRERGQLKADGLIHGESQFPLSLTLTVAVLLYSESACWRS